MAHHLLDIRRIIVSALLPALMILFGRVGEQAAIAQTGIGNPPHVMPSERLEKRWKNIPGWVAMLADLSQGGQVSAREGWHRHSHSQTRFDWTSTLKRLDRDGDGKISRTEIGGSATDYSRLDRDHDGTLTAEDFAFRRNEMAQSRSKIIMSFGDLDRDGRLSTDEFQRAKFMANRDNFTLHMYFVDSVADLESVYQKSEAEGLPYLSLSDIQEVIDRNAQRMGKPEPPNPDSEFDAGSRETLLLAFARHELGAYGSGPELNEPAPDFTLQDVRTGEDVTLSKRPGAKPLVLVFGCLSLPGFRAEGGNLLKLHHRYKDRADFLFIYVRESNTVDGWRVRANDEISLKMNQPATLDERKAVAKYCNAKLGLGMPTVADTLDDRVTNLYSGSPSRLYLVDPQGKIAYKGGRGPFGFKPAELEQSLLLLLQSNAESQPPAIRTDAPTDVK